MMYIYENYTFNKFFMFQVERIQIREHQL
jgi:hypothetical protein